MFRRNWVLMAAAAAVVCVWTTTGRAGDDTVRLDLKKGKEAATVNLLGDGGADTVDVRWHGGYHHGYHHGFHHGWNGYGFYRPYYYRPWASFGLSFAYPYYDPYYYPRYYYAPYVYAPPVYYTPPAYYVLAYSYPDESARSQKKLKLETITHDGQTAYSYREVD